MRRYDNRRKPVISVGTAAFLEGGLTLPKLKPIGTSTHADRIGKVFYVINQNLRQCLICDGVFPREAAAEHAGTLCFPSQKPQELGLLVGHQLSSRIGDLEKGF
jgi:hypothetical protein